MAPPCYRPPGNEAFRSLTDTVAPERLVPPVSIPRLLLHPKGMAPRIVNLGTWAWHVIEALSREEERHPSERREALITELEAIVPKRPPASSSEYVGLAVPLRLSSREGELQLLTTLTRFGTAEDVTVGELRLEAFLPADEATASILTGAARQRHRETV